MPLQRSYREGITDAAGKILTSTGGLLVGKDMAQRLVATLRHQEQDLRLSSPVFEHAAEGIIITDAEERNISINRSFRHITGYDETSIIGQTPRLLQSGQYDQALYRRIHNALEAFGVWSGTTWTLTCLRCPVGLVGLR